MQDGREHPRVEVVTVDGWPGVAVRPVAPADQPLLYHHLCHRVVLHEEAAEVLVEVLSVHRRSVRLPPTPSAAGTWGPDVLRAGRGRAVAGNLPNLVVYVVQEDGTGLAQEPDAK